VNTTVKPLLSDITVVYGGDSGVGSWNHRNRENNRYAWLLMNELIGFTK
jgi:hypothetical protein